jgi:hypothetical protein
MLASSTEQVRHPTPHGIHSCEEFPTYLSGQLSMQTPVDGLLNLSDAHVSHVTESKHD